jgi:uncharacterized protein YcbK (DUF882 family)
MLATTAALWILLAPASADRAPDAAAAESSDAASGDTTGDAHEHPAEAHDGDDAVDESTPSRATGVPERIAPFDPTRAPTLRLLRRGKLHTVDLFDDHGNLLHDGLAELRTLMTDPRSGIDHPTHWRLATLLVAVANHFPGATIEIVSGYRHVSRHTDRSNHTRGRAIDMRVEGVGKRRLFEVLRRSFADVGVGYYPNGSFVHLDVRDRATIWVDYSGAAQTPCYSRTPAADLADGTAERTSYDAALAAGCRRA